MAEQTKGEGQGGNTHEDTLPYGNYTLSAAPAQPSLQDVDPRPGPDPTVKWICPMCRGPEQSQDLRSPTILSVAKLDNTTPDYWVVSCDCGISHPGAGSNGGCGYAVLLQQNTRTGFEPLATDLRPWLAQMNAAELSALSDMRTSASTWAGSIATALGAVSLSALLTGSKTFSALATGAAHAGEILFIVAGGFAIVAIAIALTVAMVSKLRPYGSDPGIYRLWATTKVKNGIRLLHLSQALAAVGAGLALAAAGVLFFGNPAAPEATTINVSGTTLCSRNTTSPTPPAKTSYAVQCGEPKPAK